MTDQNFDAIDAAMKSLRSYRRDKLADRKRQARGAIAQTIDAWAASVGDETYDRFVDGIVAVASEKCRKLILAEYPLRRASSPPEMTFKQQKISLDQFDDGRDASPGDT